jgi:hypothetical protein
MSGRRARLFGRMGTLAEHWVYVTQDWDHSMTSQADEESITGMWEAGKLVYAWDGTRKQKMDVWTVTAPFIDEPSMRLYPAGCEQFTMARVGKAKVKAEALLALKLKSSANAGVYVP